MAQPGINYQEKLSESKLTGNLYYSQLQHNYLKDQGRKCFIGKLLDGRIVNYTELVNVETLADGSFEGELPPDAVLLGQGTFMEWEP